MTDASMKVSYPKEMKEKAKKDKKPLCCIDVPGMTFKGPVDQENITEAVKMLTRWFESWKDK